MQCFVTIPIHGQHCSVTTKPITVDICISGLPNGISVEIRNESMIYTQISIFNLESASADNLGSKVLAP